MWVKNVNAAEKICSLPKGILDIFSGLIFYNGFSFRNLEWEWKRRIIHLYLFWYIQLNWWKITFSWKDSESTFLLLTQASYPKSIYFEGWKGLFWRFNLKVVVIASWWERNIFVSCSYQSLWGYYWISIESRLVFEEDIIKSFLWAKYAIF